MNKKIVSKINIFIRRKAIKLLCNKKINKNAIVLLKKLSRFIPEKFVNHMLVVGKISILLPDGKYLFMESSGEDLIARDLFWNGFKGYEYETTRLFYELAKKSRIILDIGANTGYYTLLAASCNKNGKNFAFEPLPKIYECLKKNIALSKSVNVNAFSSAVTNFDGQISIYVPKEDGILPLSVSTLEGFIETERELKVPAISVDSFVYKNQIEKVDLIKIDTEGTEHVVLEGAKHTLQRDKPMIICEVLKGRTEKLLEPLLSNLGYKYYWITDKGLIQKEIIDGDSTGKYKNYFFCIEDEVDNILKSDT